MVKDTLVKFLKRSNNKIENEDQFLELVALIAREEKSYLFRGQANSVWKLESSFFRIKNISSKKNSLFVFKERIKYIKERYSEKDNLTLASQMQHNDVETILIDFTSNFYHAFWFAFSELEENIKLIKNQDNLKYRSLYLLKKDENILYKIDDKNGWEDKNKIYRCPLDNKRGISQKSYFIIDNQDWNKNSNLIKIDINNKLSEKIINFLTKKEIIASTIFPDLQGLKLEFENSSKYFIIEKAFYLIQTKNYKEAIKKCNKIIKLDPNFIFAYNYKGICLSELKNYKKAIEYFDKAIQINPNFSDVYNNKGISLNELGKYQEAIKFFDKTIELDLNYSDYFSDVYNNKGISLRELGKYQEALECFDKAIKIN